jgi:DNA-directed RNA polymerase subunit RPC12/RpoP
MELEMAMLMLKCPNTGRDFSTGIDIDQHSCEELPKAMSAARCPHCGVMHGWQIRHVRWVESIPASQWVEGFDPPFRLPFGFDHGR